MEHFNRSGTACRPNTSIPGYASELISRISGPLKVLDTHDVDHQKNREIRRRLKAGPARVFRWLSERNNAQREIETVGRHALVLAITEADRRFFEGAL